MKKIMLVFSMISALLLAGCGADKIDQTQNIIDDGQTENIEQVSGENDLVNATENYNRTAKEEILNALKDSEWVKENVTMKKTCFGEDFTLPQELTFEMLRDDLAIVQAYAYETDGEVSNFGTQVFLVGYVGGEVKSISLPEETAVHPGHGGFGVDSEKMVLVYYWMHQGVVKNTAYDINDFSFEEIDSLSLESMDENTEADIMEFNQKYNTYSIETPLTEENLNI